MNLAAGVESRWINLNSHRVHYLVAGRGPAVVLLHGGASDARDWLPVMTALSRNFTFFAPDIIGYGQSERKEPGYYLSDFGDFLLSFVAALGLERPALVGHSFGARICLEAALRQGERFNRLVLVDAVGLGKVTRFGSCLLTFFWLLRRIARRPQPYPKFLTQSGEDTNWLCLDELPGLKMPVMLVWKRFDPYLPVAQARHAVRIIPGARLHEFPGFGHAPHKDSPAAFSRLLQEYLGGS